MPFRSLSYSGITFKKNCLPEKIHFFVLSADARKKRKNGVSRFYQNNTLLPAKALPVRL